MAICRRFNSTDIHYTGQTLIHKNKDSMVVGEEQRGGKQRVKSQSTLKYLSLPSFMVTLPSDYQDRYVGGAREKDKGVSPLQPGTPNLKL